MCNCQHKRPEVAHGYLIANLTETTFSMRKKFLIRYCKAKSTLGDRYLKRPLLGLYITTCHSRSPPGKLATNVNTVRSAALSEPISLAFSASI
eukprot:173024-Pyramimonas_sp.AAC.1